MHLNSDGNVPLEVYPTQSCVASAFPVIGPIRMGLEPVTVPTSVDDAPVEAWTRFSFDVNGPPVIALPAVAVLSMAAQLPPVYVLPPAPVTLAIPLGALSTPQMNSVSKDCGCRGHGCTTSTRRITVRGRKVEEGIDFHVLNRAHVLLITIEQKFQPC